MTVIVMPEKLQAHRDQYLRQDLGPQLAPTNLELLDENKGLAEGYL